MFIVRSQSATERASHAVAAQSEAHRSAEPSPQVRPEPDDEFYVNFAAQIAKLKPAERAKLAANFAKSQKDARRSGRVEEAQHYARLVMILNSR
jgi:hypothetical protein